MKRVSALIVFVLFIGACDSLYNAAPDRNMDTSVLVYNGIELIEADTTDIAPDILDRYREDAGILAVRYIKEKDSSRIRIPETLVDIFFHGLIHIYQSGSTEIDGIHTRNPGDAREQLLFFDSQQVWTQQWADGKRFTGNVNIDELIKKYDLHLKKYIDFHTTSDDAAVLISQDPLNHEALGERFMKLKEINAAGANSTIGGTTDIEAEVEKKVITFGYTKGWGDCISGCINEHHWIFEVSSDGKAELVARYGDEL